MDDLEFQADRLAQKIRHFIITSSRQTSDKATIGEFYQALCSALREEIMINWTATLDSIQNKKNRIAYFLSMEYLPGRLTANNLTNIGALDLVKAVLAKMNRNLSDLLACEPDPGLGNGGLGRLSSCFLDSLATLHYPARAYGLRYQYGIFEQEIWGGKQIERPDCWLLNLNPWEQRRDTHAINVNFGGKLVLAANRHGEEIHLLEGMEEVRALPYDIPVIGYSKKRDFSVLSLRLWSTKESPRNFLLQRFNAGLLGQAAENTSLTDVLYPNDNTEIGKRVRLKQEFLLVSASLQDIILRHLRIFGDLSQFSEKVRIQINDTHPALVIAELVRTLVKNHDFTWQDAWETCKAVCSYTNHSLLREALEEWNESRVHEVIPRQHRIIQKLNLEFCNSVRRQFPDDEEKVRRLSIIEHRQVRMAHLAIVGSHKVNGVAKLHGEILKHLTFRDFHDLWPEKFTSITNGVTVRRWLLHANPRLAHFISQRIGDEWITDFKRISQLSPFASDRTAQTEFLEIKRENKRRLIEYLKEENPIRDPKGTPISAPHLPGEHFLFDIHIKRIHEYKRQLMNVMHLIMIYQELKQNPDARPIARFSIFSGKAAPGYIRAKQIIQLINAVARRVNADSSTNQKLSIAFIENYNVSKAEIIIPAADLSEQISTAGCEASGTGNMKLSINGALTIGTEDGANIEMRESITDAWWPFSFGASAKQNTEFYNPYEVYDQDPSIRRAVDALCDGSFASTMEETESFAAIQKGLLEGDNGAPPDNYRVLQDLGSYYQAQKKVEELFLQPHQWAETALRNIAGMGPFSTDESIRRYAEEIWGVSPCPPDPQILEKVRSEYAEHDRCKINGQ